MKLRAEHPVELGLAADAGRGDVDVADPSAAGLLDLQPVGLDPGQVAQPVLARQGRHQNLARALEARSVVDRQEYRGLRQTLEGRPRVLGDVDRRAVDGQHPVALGDVHAGLGERRALLGVPGRAAHDLRDAVGPVGELPVHAEESDAALGGLLDVAAAAVGVGGVELADQLADDEVEVPPGHDVVEQGAVALAHRLPVDPVHGGVVEVVALESPRVGEDLPPFLRRHHRHLHGTGRQRFLHLLPGSDVDDREAAFGHRQELAAVGRYRVPVGVVEDRLLLALLEVPEDDRRGPFGGAGSGQAPVEDLALDRCRVVVAARLRRQHDRPRLEAFEVDLHRRRLGLLLRVPGAVGLPARAVVIRCRFVAVCRLDVVAGRKRRRHVRPQRHRHQLRRVGIDPGRVEVRVQGLEGLVGEVVEVLPLGVEDRIGGTDEARGHLVPLA